MVKSWKSFLSIKYYFNLLVVYCMLQCTFSAAIESKMVKEETCDGGFYGVALSVVTLVKEETTLEHI